MALKIGLVGCGRWGRNILRDLIALGAQTHVVDVDQDAAEQARRVGAASADDRIEALPPECAGFVVATPTVTHAAVTESLLLRGRPVFVEKPLTASVDDAQRLCTAAAGRVFVMDKWRYHHGVEALAGLARSGELGEIQAMRTQRVGLRHPHKDVDPSWILLPHDLSIVLEIIGHLPEARAAWSSAGKQDMLAVLGGQGLQVSIEIAANQPLEKRSAVVIGSRAVAQLAGAYDEKVLIAERNGAAGFGAVRELPFPQEMPLRRELQCFLQHLSGGPPPRSSAADGLLVVTRIAALRRLAGMENG
jgi:predicted dehydrogenase